MLLGQAWVELFRWFLHILRVFGAIHVEIELQDVFMELTGDQVTQSLLELHVELLHFMAFNHELAKMNLVLLHNLRYLISIFSREVVNILVNLHVYKV